MSSVEERADRLTQALNKGQAADIVDCLGVLARTFGLTRLARKSGLSRTTLYRMLKRENEPRLMTVITSLNLMGLEIVVRPKEGETDGRAQEISDRPVGL